MPNESKEALSEGAQERGCFEHGQRAFLWVDGVTYADNYSKYCLHNDV